jgi:hypothetical protein
VETQRSNGVKMKQALRLSLGEKGWRAFVLNMVSLIKKAEEARSISILPFVATLVGALIVALLWHEPIPRVNDEFSYLLSADTLASGKIYNPTPSSPEFFDTFHVLIQPRYASKYFPAQGLFLALGQRLTGHPAVGIWLSSALACAAACEMLTAWIGMEWGLFGSLLMVVQLGVFSYWSQSYWGGMVAALGGALCFGVVRRLCDHISWRNSVWFSIGLVILANSRPLEGLIAMMPMMGFMIVQIIRKGQAKRRTFWKGFVLPVSSILILGAVAMGIYSRSITGSFFEPPYLLHERQYQESPQFVFMPVRPALTYSSPWVRYLYEVMEMRLYMSQRTPLNVMITAARKLRDWWGFYCSVLLSFPLVLLCLLKPGWTRFGQILVLAGFILTATFYVQESTFLRIAIDLLSVAQFVLLWYTFEEVWSRLALASIGLLILESFLLKYAFPHYYAPTACLVLYLQVEAMRRIWYWRKDSVEIRAVNRNQRRSAARQASNKATLQYPLRAFVVLIPIACLISLVVRVEAKVNDWKIDFGSPEIDFLPAHDWSLNRAEIQDWLEKQPGRQLVFVRYFRQHDVNREWVWNRADLMHAKVVWARDLGSEHNSLLLQQMPDRKVWSLLADMPDPKLVPYDEVLSHAPNGLPPPDDPPFSSKNE